MELFEEQVRESEKQEAVSDGEEELSYEELNERANQLGRYLREQGVGVEERVGVWMERGVEMVVGMLGIWKAGGVYVPLEQEYPRERVEYMVKDAGVKWVLSRGSGASARAAPASRRSASPAPMPT